VKNLARGKLRRETDRGKLPETREPQNGKTNAWSNATQIATPGGSRGTRAKIATQEVRDSAAFTGNELAPRGGVFMAG